MFPNKAKRPINLGSKRPVSTKQALRNAEKQRERRQAQRHDTQLVRAIQNMWRSRKLVWTARIEFAQYLAAHPDHLRSSEQFVWVLPVFRSLDRELQERLRAVFLASPVTVAYCPQLLLRFPALWRSEGGEQQGRADPTVDEASAALRRFYIQMLQRQNPTQTAPLVAALLEHDDYSADVLVWLAQHQPEQFLLAVLTGPAGAIERLPLETVKPLFEIHALDATNKRQVQRANVEALIMYILARSQMAESWPLQAFLIGLFDGHLSIPPESMPDLISFETLQKIQNGGVDLLANYYTALTKTIPITKLLLRMALLSPSPIKQLWDVYEQRGSDQHLGVVVELYSYWLRVATDAEIIDSTAIGFGLADFKKLAGVVKDNCYFTLWQKKYEENIDIRVGRFEWMQLKLLRQIYTRDLRMHILGPAFWIFDGIVDEEYVKKPTNLEFLWRNLFLQPPSFDMLSDTVINSYCESNDDMGLLDLPGTPLLRVVEHAPFFIPFRTRAYIFYELLSLDRMTSSQTERTTLVFPREDLLQTTKTHFLKLGPRLRSQPRVKFSSGGIVEEGIDGGGLTRELLMEVAPQAFLHGGLGVTTSLLGKQPMFVENDYHFLAPNTVFTEDPMYRTSEVVDNFVFLGQLVGKCIYEGMLLDFEFAHHFLTKWCQASSSTFDDLKLFDPLLYKNLSTLQNLHGADVANLGLDFTVTGHNQEQIELCDGGEHIAVTDENKVEYMMELARYKLVTSIKPQSLCFLTGLTQVINLKCLNMFNASELSTLISGDTKDIDIDDLRLHAVVSGFTSQGDFIDRFWNTVASFTPAQRRRFLKFVTSLPRGPLLGFRVLEPQFGIRCSGSNDAQYPTAATCVNLLRIPEYSSEEILRQRLLYIVNSDHGFELE